MMKLDMYEFCTTELQQKLSPMRTKFKEQEEKKMVIFSFLLESSLQQYLRHLVEAISFMGWGANFASS